jgi:predicted GNAT family N-acyltransferase
MINTWSGKMTEIRVKKIESSTDLELAHKIRYEVFVEGQNVPPEEEIDQYENGCIHFLAWMNNIPCGAARWRKTESGIKLERFAVLEPFRGKGVGSALVKAVLRDIQSDRGNKGKLLYLHAQISAMPLYEKFGFVKHGDLFLECDIEHYSMVRS